MKYSILIPCYNCEKYISRCLKSIAREFLCDYEIIIVDDGSTDSTKRIIKNDFKEQPIHLFEQDHKGVAKARNVCLNNAQGKYFLFIDADDEIAENYFSTVEKYTQEAGFDIFHFNFSFIDEKGKDTGDNKKQIEGKYTGKEIINQAYLQDLYSNTLWANVYNREFIFDNHLSFHDGIVHEDEDFILRSLLVAKIVFSCNDRIYLYRRNPESITRNDSYLYQRTKDKFTVFKDFVDDKSIDKDVQKNLYCYLAMAVLLEGTHYSSNSEDFQKFKKDFKDNRVLSYLYSFNFFYFGLIVLTHISLNLTNALLRSILRARSKEA